MDLITNHTHTLHTHTHLLPIRHVLYVGVVMPTVHTVTHVNNDCKQFAKFHHWVELDRHLGHLRRAKMKQIAGLEFMVFICVCDVCCVLCAVYCVLTMCSAKFRTVGNLTCRFTLVLFTPSPPRSPLLALVLVVAGAASYLNRFRCTAKTGGRFCVERRKWEGVSSCSVSRLYV